MLIISIVGTIICFTKTSYADDESLVYSGSTTASWGYEPNCTFKLTAVKNNRFRGVFSVSNIGAYSFSENISGAFYSSDHSFTCIFTVYFYEKRYYSNITLTAYPEEGYCDCFCEGSWHMENFRMYGARFIYGNNNSSITGNEFYDENEMILCANLSSMIYDSQTRSSFVNKNKNYLVENHIETNSIKYNNYILDTNSDNVAFAIMSIIESELTAKMIVVVRGTYNDEWQGNMKITGDSYDPNCTTHENFDEATDSIKNKVKSYYNNLKKNYKYVDLMITGHSRGAAVANLYAKHAIDRINGADNDDIPLFHSVCAYTFACPNVAVYEPYMENYISIFNFEFFEDLIPTIPLTKPTAGWNYWKYGKTLSAFLVDPKLNGILTYKNKIIKNGYVDIIHKDFSEWNSVEQYYNKAIVGYYADDVLGVIPKYTTLYNFACDATGVFKSNSLYRKQIALLNFKEKFGIYPSLNRIIIDACKNIESISGAHSQHTYQNVINSFGDSLFDEYNYSNVIGNSNLMCLNSSIYDITYCETEVSCLLNIYNQSSNSNVLAWDASNPSTFEGITWDSSGNVTEIDLAYLDLDGSLDLSNFSSLQRVDISGNNITNIDVSGCSSLTSLNVSDNKIELLDISDCTSLMEFDCSFNDLSTNGIDVSSNTDLTSFICDGCSLNSIDISSLVDLQEFSCSFNSLTTLSLDNNNALSSIICCYNYLDTHEGSALYNTLDDLMFDDVYVNYYPQSVPDNATFNTAELNALKTFANIDSNNSVLDWLDEDGNIDTNKLQNNVLFEYDGSNYRIVAIDISELEITGSLDLTAFAQLKELYCSQTGITSVNVNNCTKLEIIDCSDSQLSMLTLPSNSGDKNTPLYKVMCENNHLDINIFTDDIIKYVTFKAGSQLDYKHQIINASADEFDENDYNALCTFANQKDNLSSLDWDLTAPGEWDYVNWKLDTVSGKYKLLDCYFDCLDITGDIDLSGCTALEYASFSGSDIETAKLPVLTEKLYTANTVETVSLGANENAFYDCPKLEAVVISPLAEKIESGAFYNCKALQAVYVPESVISIADNSFGNCPNLTLAGADETTVSEYAFENSISFEEGYFLCARVNCQENTSGTFSAYYPIEDAQIINGDTVCAQTDEYGFFTVFGLEDGQYSYTVSYKFGFNVPLNASISGGCKTVTPPIAMPAFNFNRDGYITMRDYTMLVKITQDSEDFKYYDINRDSVIDNVEKNLFTGLWNMAASDVISYNV